MKENELSNIQSVQFIVASPKVLFSKHAGSILSQSEPIIELEKSDLEKAKKAYHDILLSIITATTTTSAIPTTAATATVSAEIEENDVHENNENHALCLKKENLCDLLVNYGIITKKYDKNMIMNIIEKLYINSPLYINKIDENKWISVLQLFYAPSYNYGQRLRMLAGRGEVDDMCELIIR